MNKCSVEIVALIFDFACDDVGGDTARRLGLVCKYFREIAEPLEFRFLSISGFLQLENVSTRLAKAMGQSRKLRIEHLLICDYNEKYALWSDSQAKFDFGFPILSKAQTFEGRLFASRYRDQNHDFWSLAHRLLFLASSTVKTLYLISFNVDSYKKCNPAEFVYEDGVLTALRGQDFPSLMSLTIKHAPVIDPTLSALSDKRWKYPVARKLHRLRLITHCRLQVRQVPGSNRSYVDYHPLLIGIHKWHPQLRHLEITSSEFTDVESLFQALCKLEGHNGIWYDTVGGAVEAAERDLVRNCLERRVIPGNLDSVRVCIGRNLAKSGLEAAERSIYQSRITGFQNDAEQRNIKGLTVVPPTPAFPEAGKREYEVLVAEWTAQVNIL